MALTRQEIIEKTGCEKVLGQLIVGVGPNRILLGSTVDGVFSLTPEGEEYLANLGDAPVKATRGRKKKEVVEEVQDEPAVE